MHRNASDRDRLEDLKSGAAVGALIALFLSAYALIIYLLAGGAPDDSEIALETVIALYMATGVLGGALVGLARGVAAKWWGAILMGGLVGGPCFLGLSLIIGGEEFIIEFVKFGAFVFGPIVGFMFWGIFRLVRLGQPPHPPRD